jgi:hypothetical protein
MVENTTDEHTLQLLNEERVEEIALLTRLMVEATSRNGPLPQNEIDELLAHSPVVMPIAARSVE